MADFASLIYGTAQNVAQNVGQGVPESFARGADLAIRQEQIQLARQELEDKKVNVEIQQNKDILDAIELAERTKDPNMQKMILGKVVPAKVKAYGLNQTWSSDVLEALQKSPEARAKAIGLRMDLEERVSRGQITAAQAKSEFEKAISDPVVFSQTDADKLYEASKFATVEKGKIEAARLRGQQGEQRGGQIQGRFEQSQKTKLVDKINSLGLPALKSSFAELDSAMPGGIDGWKQGQKIPGVSGAEGALAVNRLKGQANKIRGAAASVGNQILKLRSGAAVSDGEAARTLAELGMTPVIGEGGTWTGLAFKGITSEEAFVNGMKRARAMVQNVESSYRNAYGGEVYDSVSAPLKSKSAPKNFKMSNGKEYSEMQLRAYLQKYPKTKLADEIRKLQGFGNGGN